MVLSALIRRGWRIAAAGGMVATATVIAPISVASTASAAPASPSGTMITSTGLTSGAIKHVWLIILENKSYDATFTGLNQNSYLWQTLPQQGVLLKNYYGTSHFSQGNYESMVSGQAAQQDLQSDCDVAAKDFGSTVNTTSGDANYGQAVSAKGPYTGLGTSDPARDGQNGCVFPQTVPTLFNQLDSANVSWKGYAQDIGAQAGREDATCAGVGAAANNPTSNPTLENPPPTGGYPAGITSYTGAQPNDQYVAKHFPFPWFHSLIDNPADCNASHIANLDGATGTYTGTGLAQDLQSAATTPAFSWISPNNCSDAHDAVCRGNNMSGAFNPDGSPNYTAGPYKPLSTTPTNYTGGLYASDLFLRYYIPLIEQSQAFKDGGLIDVTFDEANPPFTYTGNSFYNSTSVPANAATGLASDASGWNVNGTDNANVPAGPNSPLGTNSLGAPDPGPGDNAFINRTPAGARTDTNGAGSGNGQQLGPVSGGPSSSTITDFRIAITDQGRAVSGTNIPANSFVGPVSDTGTTAATSYGSGGQAVAGSFTLVDASNNPVLPTGPVSAVTLAARSATGANADPLYDPTSPTPGGGDTGSVLISPYITPGTTTTRYYNHYSWLRTMEDIFNVGSGSSTTPISGGAGTVSGGLDSAGHLGFAATTGLMPFGADVFNNASGNPPNATPELPLAVGLPVAGLLVAGGYLLLRSRRSGQMVSH